MLVNMSNSIRELIISSIQKGSRNIVELISDIQKNRPNTTKQAVYTAIRNLKREEVVVVHKKHISLNKVWVKNQLNFFTIADSDYTHEGSNYDNLLLMEEGDKITYFFKSAYATDQYWAHLYETMVENMDKSMPAVLYNPHEWFLVARKESEEMIFNRLSSQSKLMFMVIGGTNDLDKLVVKTAFKQWKHQYNFRPDLKFDKNYYINIFGDFIIEAKLDEKVSLEIDEFFSKYKILTPSNIAELKIIVSKRGKNKLMITRNKKRAFNLRKMLAYDFHVPAGYKI